MKRYRITLGQWSKLSPVFDVLNDYDIRVKWHPDSEYIIIWGDPLAATIAATKDDLLVKEQGNLIFELCHPDNKLSGAPPRNTNARKGEANRKMWSQRLPVDVIDAIKDQSETLEISQADYVVALVRQPNNAIAAELLPWLLSEPFEPDISKFNQSIQAGPQSAE